MQHREHPIVPGRLPDGSVVMERRGAAADLITALEKYDPLCALIHNTVDGTWEIWRANEDFTMGRVGRFHGETLPHPAQVIADLAAHDTRRGYDPYAAMAAADAARAAASEYAFLERTGDAAERMAWELQDEIRPHLPAARPIPLGPNPTRRVHTKEARRRGLLKP